MKTTTLHEYLKSNKGETTRIANVIGVHPSTIGTWSRYGVPEHRQAEIRRATFGQVDPLPKEPPKNLIKEKWHTTPVFTGHYWKWTVYGYNSPVHCQHRGTQQEAEKAAAKSIGKGRKTKRFSDCMYQVSK